MLQEQYPAFSYSQLIESALTDYLVLPITFYTDCISPLYTFVGSKNHKMQVATADAVDAMEIPHVPLVPSTSYCRKLIKADNGKGLVFLPDPLNRPESMPLKNFV